MIVLVSIFAFLALLAVVINYSLRTKESESFEDEKAPQDKEESEALML